MPLETKDFKPIRRNTLRGFFTLVLASGMEIRDCTFHEMNDKCWFGFPGIPFKADDGSTKYKNIIYIQDKAKLEQLQLDVAKLLDEHLDQRRIA